MTLYYSLVIAHLITDFMQPAWMVKWSKQSPYGLIIHALTYVFLSTIVLIGYPSWALWLMILGVTHFIVDEIKYNVSPRLPGWEMPIFLLDQFIHINIIIGVTFLSGLTLLPVSESSYFIAFVQPFKYYLVFVVSYIVATFSISILVFETDRTITARKGATERRIIVTFKERLLGMLERAFALTLLLLNNYFVILYPFAFTISAVKLYKNKSDNKQLKIIELAEGIIGVILVYLITISLKRQ